MFLTTEQLTPHSASRKSTIPSPTSDPAPRCKEDLSNLLTDAYLQVAEKSGNEWILLPVLGKSLRDLNPNFQETHGKKKLSLLIEQCPGIFETRLREVGESQTAEVRIRE